MLNFSFSLVGKLSGLGKAYLTVYNYINATLLFRRLLKGEFIQNLYSVLDSYWLKHVNTDWYSTSEIKVIIGMIAEALSDYKLSSREVKAIISYIIINWDPERAKTKSKENDLLDKLEPCVEKAVNVYRMVNTSLDAIKYVKEISEVLPDNLSESKLLTYVKDTFLP